MPEDGIIGFKYFETESRDGSIVNIANDAAVLHASRRLFDTHGSDTAGAARHGHLETAQHAVQAAAFRKAGLEDVDRPDDVDNNDFDDGSDFFL
jgi:hypothetical protein